VLPNIVPVEVLSNAITWNSSVQEVASVSGPAMAGLLLATVGSRSVYITQTVCAVVVLACYIALRYRSRPVTSEERDLKSLLEGVRFVRSNKLILGAISLDLFGVLFGGATALLPIYAIDILHVGAIGLGWLRAAPSIGAVAMAVATAHLPRNHAAGKTLLWAVAGFGIATVVFGLSRNIWLSFAMLLLTGAFDNISVVLRNSLVQTQTPDSLRGRVLAVNSIFIASSNQLGAVESGYTAQWFGAVASVAGGGLATVAIVLFVATVSVSLRNWRQ
jgi:MFS family permease